MIDVTMKLDLTPRQLEVLLFIIEQQHYSGFPVTYTILRKHFGFSPNGIKCHLTPLTRKGYLRMESNKMGTIRSAYRLELYPEAFNDHSRRRDRQAERDVGIPLHLRHEPDPQSTQPAPEPASG